MIINKKINPDIISIDFLNNILGELPSNIFFKDSEARYVFCTHYWKQFKIDGDKETWDIKGKTDLEVRKDKKNAELAYQADMEIIKTGIGKTYIIECNDNDGIEYLEITKRPVHDEDGNVIGIVGMINDVTEKVLQEQALEQMALTDNMTGLYNRQYLDKFYKQENNKSIYPLSIIMADCNDLKFINDNFGHHAGDEYIKKAASILRIVLPDETYVIRIGGDEFLAIIPNCSKKIADLYLKALEDLTKSIRIKGNPLSISLGCTEVKEFHNNLFEPIQEADKSMYLVKKKYHASKGK